MQAATLAGMLLDGHGQQRPERKGKQCARDNDASPISPSKCRHRSSSSPDSSSLRSILAPTPKASSSSSSSFSSMNVPPTPWVSCHISAVLGSKLVEVGPLLPKSNDKVTRALTLLGATNAQDVHKCYLKLSVGLHLDRSQDPWATDQLQLLLKAYNLLKDKYKVH